MKSWSAQYLVSCSDYGFLTSGEGREARRCVMQGGGKGVLKAALFDRCTFDATPLYTGYARYPLGNWFAHSLCP